MRPLVSNRRLAFTFAAICFSGSSAACGPCGHNTYAETHGTLSGHAVVPAVDSVATGWIETISLAMNEGSWASESTLWHITTSLPTESVTAVHMHEGAEGENGPVVFELPEVHWSRWDSVVVNASMDYEGNVSIDDLFDLMRSGRAYVDIHTVSHPGGALRGQLEVTRFEERSGYHCG